MDKPEAFKNLTYCKPISREFFGKHPIWLDGVIDFISTECRACKQIILEKDFETGYTYWQGYPVPYHKICKKLGMDNEAYECQVIDADCNDCAYFGSRKNLCKGIDEGHCLKFNKTVRAYPNFCTAHDCFVHRKDKA